LRLLEKLAVGSCVLHPKTFIS